MVFKNEKCDNYLEMIEQFNFTDKGDPNRYNRPGSEWTWE